MKRGITAGAVAAAAFLLVSCAGAPQQGTVKTPGPAPAESSLKQAAADEMPTKVITSAGGKKAVVHAGETATPREPGQRHGVLETDGAGCMVLRDQSGDDYTLIFPEGTTFDGEAAALPGGPNVAEGLAVEVGGALVPANDGVSMCENYIRLFSVDTAILAPVGTDVAPAIPY
jgi:hypothetical protein